MEAFHEVLPSELEEQFRKDPNPVQFRETGLQTYIERGCGIPPTPSQRALKGRTYEEIHGFEKAVVLKQAKGLNWLGADRSGANNANFGKHWSPEKRAEFASRRQKEDHPGFGSFWITNGIDSRKVQPGAVIEPGWRKGRVIRRPQQ